MGMEIFRRKDLLEAHIHRSSQWCLAWREGDRYGLHSQDNGPLSVIQARSSHHMQSVLFQLFLNTRFSLEKTPNLLFARLMMRSTELIWASWVAAITQSTEATVSLSARIPRATLDYDTFRFVCTEMRDEARAFDRELRDKLDYLRGFKPGQGQPPDGGWTGMNGIERRY